MSDSEDSSENGPASDAEEVEVNEDEGDAAFMRRRAGSMHITRLQEMLAERRKQAEQDSLPKSEEQSDVRFSRFTQSPRPETPYSVIPRQTKQISQAPAPTTHRSLTSCFRSFRPETNYPMTITNKMDAKADAGLDPFGKTEVAPDGPSNKLPTSFPSKHERRNWLSEADVFPPIYHEITDESFDKYTGNDVDMLNLSGCDWLKVDSLIKIGMKCKTLTHLSLENIPAADDSVILSITLGCPDLEVLNLNSCTKVTGKGLHMLGKGCPKLRMLWLGSIATVDDGVLKTIGEHCSGLHLVDLSYCSEVTDEGIQALTEGCKKLTALYLNGCRGITDGSIDAITTNCKLLEELQLNTCIQPTITTAGIEKLFLKLKLFSLCMTGMSQIEDKAFKKMKLGATRLENLIVSGVSELQDMTIRSFATDCPSLVHLDLSMCKLVSDNTIQALVRKSPKIRTIVVNCCEQISDDTMGFLARQVPHVRVVKHISNYSEPPPAVKMRPLPGFKPAKKKGGKGGGKKGGKKKK
eukprot:GFYU01007915.1.p1 GENE.GFYU01007915.1~~GFYU01007915.1.p1  ORF type:complete len:523 (+),score=98.53 GFYU01007915.1:176-1744(+)